MGYSAVERVDARAEVDFDSATSIAHKVSFKRPVTLLGWGIAISEATDAAQTTAAVMSIQTKVGSASATELDTLTIPVSSAIGHVYERSALMKSRTPVSPDANFDPVDVDPGTEIQLVHKTQGSTTEAGKGYLYLLYVPKGSQ